MSTSQENKRNVINKMKNDIENTETNIRQTEKMINTVEDEEVKATLEIKNSNRENSLRNMKETIKNEYDKENNVKNNW